jgi:nitrite reductase (NADH) small subunit
MSVLAVNLELEPAELAPDATTWIDVGCADDIPDRGARRVATAIGDVAIFKTGDGGLFALLDRCPHRGGPLSSGIVHGHAVACPLHNWSISLVTGEPLGADAGKGCTPTVPLQVVDARIQLALG